MINKLHIKNFLGIQEVELKADGKWNVIKGKNGQGKTSILKAIEMAFKGKIGKDIQLIYGDEKKAEILIDTDQFSIQRTITNRTSELTIEDEKGFRMDKPQDYLNKIIGDFSFNPIEFTFLPEKEKTGYLLKILDIKLTKKELEKMIHEEIDFETESEGLELIDEAEKYFYDERTVKNREIKAKEGALREFSDQNKEMDVMELRKFDPKKIEKKREEYSDTRAEYERGKAQNDKRDMLLSEIKIAEEQIEKLKSQVEDYNFDLKGNPEVNLEKITAKGTKIKEDLAKLEAAEKEVEEFRQYQKLEQEKIHLQEEGQNIDEVVKLLQKDIKSELMAKAKMPVKGLTYEDGIFQVNGKNINNLSESEKIKISLDIAKALNKEFKLICIDGAEKMDSDSWKALEKEVKKGDFQFFITNVHATDGVEIKKGKVCRSKD